VWVDRKGHEEPISAPPRVYGPPRISPDGTRVAIGIADPADNTEIWIWNLQTETLRRLTFSNGMDGLPVWTVVQHWFADLAQRLSMKTSP